MMKHLGSMFIWGGREGRVGRIQLQSCYCKDRKWKILWEACQGPSRPLWRWTTQSRYPQSNLFNHPKMHKGPGPQWRQTNENLSSQIWGDKTALQSLSLSWDLSSVFRYWTGLRRNDFLSWLYFSSAVLSSVYYSSKHHLSVLLVLSM